MYFNPKEYYFFSDKIKEELTANSFPFFGTTEFIEADESNYIKFNKCIVSVVSQKAIRTQMYLLYCWSLIYYYFSCSKLKTVSFNKMLFDVKPAMFMPSDEEIKLYMSNPKFLWRFSEANYQYFLQFFDPKSVCGNFQMSLITYDKDDSPMMPYLRPKFLNSMKLKLSKLLHLNDKPFGCNTVDAVLNKFKFKLSDDETCEAYYSDDFWDHKMHEYSTYSDFVYVILTGQNNCFPAKPNHFSKPRSFKQLVNKRKKNFKNIAPLLFRKVIKIKIAKPQRIKKINKKKEIIKSRRTETNKLEIVPVVENIEKSLEFSVPVVEKQLQLFVPLPQPVVVDSLDTNTRHSSVVNESYEIINMQAVDHEDYEIMEVLSVGDSLDVNYSTSSDEDDKFDKVHEIVKIQSKSDSKQSLSSCVNLFSSPVSNENINQNSLTPIPIKSNELIIASNNVNMKPIDKNDDYNNKLNHVSASSKKSIDATNSNDISPKITSSISNDFDNHNHIYIQSTIMESKSTPIKSLDSPIYIFYHLLKSILFNSMVSVGIIAMLLLFTFEKFTLEYNPETLEQSTERIANNFLSDFELNFYSNDLMELPEDEDTNKETEIDFNLKFNHSDFEVDELNMKEAKINEFDEKNCSIIEIDTSNSNTNYDNSQMSFIISYAEYRIFVKVQPMFYEGDVYNFFDTTIIEGDYIYKIVNYLPLDYSHDFYYDLQIIVSSNFECFNTIKNLLLNEPTNYYPGEADDQINQIEWNDENTNNAFQLNSNLFKVGLSGKKINIHINFTSPIEYYRRSFLLTAGQKKFKNDKNMVSMVTKMKSNYGWFFKLNQN